MSFILFLLTWDVNKICPPSLLATCTPLCARSAFPLCLHCLAWCLLPTKCAAASEGDEKTPNPQNSQRMLGTAGLELEDVEEEEEEEEDILGWSDGLLLTVSLMKQNKNKAAVVARTLQSRL